MPLTARQGFVAGFLMRCAHEGLSPEETQERIKCAAEKVANGVISGLGQLAGYGLALPIGIGVGGGALAGLTAAGLKNDETDPEEIKNDEMIAALRFYADNARRSRRRLGLRANTAAPSAPSLRF